MVNYNHLYSTKPQYLTYTFRQLLSLTSSKLIKMLIIDSEKMQDKFKEYLNIVSEGKRSEVLCLTKNETSHEIPLY